MGKKIDACELHIRAEYRVDQSRRLRRYKYIILADWREGDDHLRWVIRATVAEIESWAKQIEDGV
jgi:hypothetical protein